MVRTETCHWVSLRLTFVAEQAEANRKRPKIETNSGAGGFTGASDNGARLLGNNGVNATGPYVPRGGGAPGPGTSEYTSPSSHDSSTTFHPLKVQSVSPSTTKPATISPPRRSRSPSDVARYRDGVLRTAQQQQEALTAPITDTEAPFFPRIHSTIQSPHIQQPSSFMRHQPVGTQSSPRPGPPITTPTMRKSSMRPDDTLPPTPTSMASSSASSTAPSLTPSVPGFDDSGRSHRSLPSFLPPPTLGSTPGSGYFDQRPHHSQSLPSRSPRTFPRHQKFSPTPMGHPVYHDYQSTSQLPTINQSSHESSNMSRNPTSGGIRQSPAGPGPPSGR